MPSVFSLFGELKVDVNAFRSQLAAADASLNQTARGVTGLEQRTESLGRTTAVSARGIAAYNEKIAAIRSRLSDASAAFQRGEITQRQMAAATASAHSATDRLNASLATQNARLSDAVSRSRSFQSALSGIGSTISSAGTALAVSLTAPLSYGGKQLFDLGAGADAMRNRLTAATGSTETAVAKLAELRKLAASSAGVFSDGAVDLYTFFKPMKLGEKTIEDLTRSFGRLQLADPQFESKEFGRNLTQLFSQGFELEDIKQAVGRFPRFGEIIGKQFGLKDTSLSGIQEGLKGLKATGQLTMENFLAGFADAVNNDSVYASLADTVGVRMSKAFERVQVALEPFALAFAQAVEQVAAKAGPYIERLAAFFSSLSPVMKTVTFALAALAAAAGPALLILGGAVTAIGSVVGSVSTIAGALAGVALAPLLAKIALVAGAVALALGAAAAAAYGLYLAWQTNFGGIRDLTLAVWEGVKTVVFGAMTFIQTTVTTIGGAVVGWWNENYPLIESIVTSVSESIKGRVAAFLTAVSEFWAAHGKEITATAAAAWEFIKTTVEAVAEQVGNAVTLVLQIINGDWQGAWDSFLEIVRSATRYLLENFLQLATFVARAFDALVRITVDYGARFGNAITSAITAAVAWVVETLFTLPVKILQLVPKMIAAGVQIGRAIWEGIRAGLAGETGLSAGAVAASGDTAGAAASIVPPSALPKFVVPEIESKEAKEAREKETKALQDQAKKMREALTETRSGIFAAAADASGNPFVKLFEDGALSAAKLLALTKQFSPALKNAALGAAGAQFGGNLVQQRIENQLEAFDLKQKAATFREGLTPRRLVSYAVEGGALGRETINYMSGGAFKTPQTFTDEQKKIQEKLREQVGIIKNTSREYEFNGKKQVLDKEQSQRLIDANLTKLFSSVDPKDLDASLREQAASAFERTAAQKATEENNAAKFFENMNSLFAPEGLKVRGIEQKVEVLVNDPRASVTGSATRPGDLSIKKGR